jgi:hypothetical protein
MPILKAPLKQIRNATIQVRVEEEVDLKLRKYAEYIGSTPAFVVAETLKLLFHKDTEFREWFSHHDNAADSSKPGKLAKQEHEPTQEMGPTPLKESVEHTRND